MEYTSAEAAKLLRKLNEELQALRDREEKTSVFVAALEEDLESVRPSYDYGKAQEKVMELEQKIRTVKHAINRFNVMTEVPEFHMTVDQMLVYLPQLTERKRCLAKLASRLPKEREDVSGYRNGIIQYSYANYDIERAEQDLKAVTDELAAAQTALDVLNNSVKFEIML